MKYILLLIGLMLIVAGCTTTTTDSQSIEGLSQEVESGDNIKEFSKEEYDLAIAEGKTVMLVFFADWCPSCSQEKTDAKAASLELTNEDVIIFMVNYKDKRTDHFEEQLAKEHGVAYQHLKVIIKNGETVLKSPAVWNKQDYLDNLETI